MSATTHDPLINCHSVPRSQTLVGTLRQSVADTLRIWRDRIRERQAFPALTDRDLRDLRISRWELDRELGKPFWRG